MLAAREIQFVADRRRAFLASIGITPNSPADIAVEHVAEKLARQLERAMIALEKSGLTEIQARAIGRVAVAALLRDIESVRELADTPIEAAWTPEQIAQGLDRLINDLETPT